MHGSEGGEGANPFPTPISDFPCQNLTGLALEETTTNRLRFLRLSVPKPHHTHLNPHIYLLLHFLNNFLQKQKTFFTTQDYIAGKN